MERGAKHAVVMGIAFVAAAAALCAGWQVLPLFISFSQFRSDVRAQAKILGVSRGREEDLRRAIYLDAQTRHIPLQPDDIQIDSDALRPRVAVNYSVPAELFFLAPLVHFHAEYPAQRQLVSPFDRTMLSGLGFLLGVFWFFQGFVLFRKLRVIADTPLVPIRSAAMGLVQIRGKATGEKTLLSPISNQPCFLYAVEIDRWISGRSGSGRWSPYLTDMGWAGFYLEDETGSILVNPEGAEFDLEESFQCDIASRGVVPLSQPWSSVTPVSRAGLPATNDDLRAYVRRVASGVDTSIFQGGDLPAHGLAGSARRKPRRGVMSWIRPLFDSFLTFEMAGLGGDFDHAAGDYRLTEHLVVDGGSYDITGTCLLNPKAQAGPEGSMIAKGSNAPTFLISDKTEKVIEEDLRGRARVKILGGALLALGAAAALLEVMGLLI